MTMGDKGRTTSPDAPAVAARAVDRLASLGATSKAMFGGHGLFVDGVMFGMVTSDGTLAFRADDDTAERYEAHGADRPLSRMPYWTVPADVAAEDATFEAWAREALDVARAAKR